MRLFVGYAFGFVLKTGCDTSSQDTLVAVSHFLAQVAKDFFARVHGW